MNSKIMSALPPTGKENDIVIISSELTEICVVDSDPPQNLPINGGYVEYGVHKGGKPTITIKKKPEVKLTLHSAYQKVVNGMESREAYVYSGGHFLKFSSRSIPVSELPDPVKTKVLIRDPNSFYYEVPVIWRLADRNHYSADHMYPQNAVTLISEYILTLKAFDAKEPGNTAEDYSGAGNPRYLFSNILLWLNSGAEPGQWYSAQHPNDAPPTTENLSEGCNPYQGEAGFLNGFSSAFKNSLIATTYNAVKPSRIGGGYEAVTSKMILPSRQEVGGGIESNLDVSKPLEIFVSAVNKDRLAYLTEEAIKHAAYDPRYNANGKFTEAWQWRLRTPRNFSYSDDPRIVNWAGSATINGGMACIGEIGIRPMCNLPNDIQVALADDGIYDIVW